MFELTEVGIIQKLVANYDSAFPNASYLCLGILAFYSSFLRVNFCKDQVLRFCKKRTSSFCKSPAPSFCKSLTLFFCKIWN